MHHIFGTHMSVCMTFRVFVCVRMRAKRLAEGWQKIIIDV